MRKSKSGQMNIFHIPNRNHKHLLSPLIVILALLIIIIACIPASAETPVSTPSSIGDSVVRVAAPQ